MAEYDPKVIVQFANRLYNQASSLAVLYALGFGGLGAIVGGIVGLRLGGAPLVVAVVTGGGASVLGYAYGWEKAFKLRLEAQRALCALQTEINTRPVKVGETTPTANG